MLVLMVDDQYENKTKSFARISATKDNVEFLHVACAKDALKVLRARQVDLLVLDLQIPTELGQDVDPNGGIQLLEFIEVNKEIKKPTKILGVTAHIDSFVIAQPFFHSRGWALLESPSFDELQSLLDAQLMSASNSSRRFDVAIITALEHTELEAVLDLPYSWEPIRFDGDISSYYTGRFTTIGGTTHSVIACSAPRMGMAASAVLTTKICLKFQPKIVAMTGIAAAVRGEAELGDIMVADPSWDWGSGKLTVKEGQVMFLSDPSQIPLDPGISATLRTLAVSRNFLDDIYIKFKGKRPPHNLSLRVGPISSGAVVLEDPATVALIKSQNRKTIGIEMEAYGVVSAAFYLGQQSTRAIVLKSVCDFADPTKGNEWQAYAAYTSAQYLDRLLINKHLPY